MTMTKGREMQIGNVTLHCFVIARGVWRKVLSVSRFKGTEEKKMLDTEAVELINMTADCLAVAPSVIVRNLKGISNNLRISR